MKQEAFEARYKDDWQQFEEWIAIMTAGRRAVANSGEQDNIAKGFPAAYRQVCHHLALARARRYSVGLQQRLNRLALDGHQYLYRARTPIFSSMLRFVAFGFPQAFRKQWRFMLASALLFCVPIAGMSVAVALDPDLIYSLISPGQVASMEEMYDPANDVLGRERESDTDALMFGFYIANNIGIGFRTYAGGLVFGIGSMFFLSFNGLYFGAVATHLTMAGFSSTFWPFVSGHSAFELTAIVIFGGAGLMLGMAAVAPGRKSRWHAIRDRAMESMPLVYGGTAMLVAAAFVEAFWSSTTWPPINLKIVVGISLWLITIIYFSLMGRRES
ncbi:MAG: stage II sporulation protein M [Pseudomonadota bacterium]